jgi:hypothetical protein
MKAPMHTVATTNQRYEASRAMAQRRRFAAFEHGIAKRG